MLDNGTLQLRLGSTSHKRREGHDILRAPFLHQPLVGAEIAISREESIGIAHKPYPNFIFSWFKLLYIAVGSQWNQNC